MYVIVQQKGLSFETGFLSQIYNTTALLIFLYFCTLFTMITLTEWSKAKLNILTGKAIVNSQTEFSSIRGRESGQPHLKYTQKKTHTSACYTWTKLVRLAQTSFDKMIK